MTSRRRSAGRSATSTAAATYVAVTRGAPTAMLTIRCVHPSNAGRRAPKIPIGAPSPSDGQNRRPYWRSASATTCPTVRVSGGSGGGSGSLEPFLATGER
jgi:hypothetical protein